MPCYRNTAKFGRKGGGHGYAARAMRQSSTRPYSLKC